MAGEGEIYTCGLCTGTFTKTWSDAEAQAEYEANFPEDAANNRPTDYVCDDCYRHIQKVVALSNDLKARGMCGEIAHSCICIMAAGHPAQVPHGCPCGGSWRGKLEDDTFVAVTLPVSPLADLLTLMVSQSVRMN